MFWFRAALESQKSDAKTLMNKKCDTVLLLKWFLILLQCCVFSDIFVSEHKMKLAV